MIFEVHCSSTSFTGTFDVTVINIGNGWVSSSNNFLVPVSGVYYFSYSFGVPSATSIWMNLLAGAANYYCDSIIWETTRNGLDTVSRGCLLSLTSGTTVKAVLLTGSADSSYAQATFRGFLYSPIQGVRVSWSVHYDASFSGSGIFPYNVIYVNVGNAWSTSNFRVTTPTAGIYYMEMVAQTYPGPIDLRLTLNYITLLSRLYVGWNNFNWITRSRSVIAYLQVGDVVFVNAISVAITGDNRQGMSFQGILLYPI